MYRARMFRVKDLKTIRRVLSYCYLGDWWVLYQVWYHLLKHIQLAFYNQGSNRVCCLPTRNEGLRQ